MARSPARGLRSKIWFDRRDHDLLRIVNGILDQDGVSRDSRRIFHPYFHPNGIKELTETRGLRIAYSVAQLLFSLEEGLVEERLNALRSLREEVVNTAQGPLAKNTARVLLAIMKEVVRAHDDYSRQLRLAHDFRSTAAGNPRVVREQLRRHHLLEMPESWNQVSFDDHVHDVHTKGRKSPTHLIMDAWIKGIRRIRVIYYNFIQPRFAAELLEAARIMEIEIRIGIEVSARFRGRYAQLIWVPRGFTDTQGFLAFLAEPRTQTFLAEGRQVSEYQQQYVFSVLEEFNRRHAQTIRDTCGIEIAPLDHAAFLAFVGSGQPSVLHLAKFIQAHLREALQDHAGGKRPEGPPSPHGEEEARPGAAALQARDLLDEDTLVERFLQPSRNPGIPDPGVPREGEPVPELLTLTPPQLIDRLIALNSGYRITLNLSNLYVEDVLEILYDCGGRITRLEIFNLKDYTAGKRDHIVGINELQRAVNGDSLIALKRVVLHAMDRVEAAGGPDRQSRVDKLTAILHDITTLKAPYNERPLKSRIASDSTGRTAHMPGMGMVIRETLPRRARREIRKARDAMREVIPLRIKAHLNVTRVPRTGMNPATNRLLRLLRRVPLLGRFGYETRESWVVQEGSVRLGTPGNVVTLGGRAVEAAGTHPGAESGSVVTEPRVRASWSHLNSSLKIFLKVFIGFVPAFLAFALTQEWGFLAYGGAFIWFGITGLRNILQSVLGGGGLRRSPLLKWNDYVSWERLSDSLFFTGFSVPLLEILVKTVLLDHGLGINTATHPVMLYAFMALANGLYLVSHNVYRGLPHAAAYGNFFRSLLSIPIAVGLNLAAGGMLRLAGVSGVEPILQRWAAIISKAASDLVAGIIEGAADRAHNIQMRYRDYRNRVALLFDTYTRLELLFPDTRVLEILSSPERFMRSDTPGARELKQLIIVCALDMLYFWMYQPRAHSALRFLLDELSDDEKQIVVRSQFILLRRRSISRLFIDGMLGGDFPRALAFYLDRTPEYLRMLSRRRDLEIPAEWKDAAR